MASKRKQPPWGDILGGKPVQRPLPRSDPLGENAENIARAEACRRLARVKCEHYGIEGDSGRDWLELAMKLGAELDDALKIDDPPPKPTHVTAPKWTDVDGLVLIRRIEMIAEEQGEQVKQEVLFNLLKAEVPPDHPYAKMSEAAIKTAYHKACNHHGIQTIYRKITKRRTK